MNRTFCLVARIVSVAVLVVCAGPRAEPAEAQGQPRRPNVLFLFTDDQREDTVGALGNPHIKTPHLDKLVESGLTFRNAYCMGGYSPAVCLPSREMTLTGRSWFAVRSLAKDAPTFPRSMNEAGYLTYHHGKRGNSAVRVQEAFARNAYLQDDADRTSGYPMRTLADQAVAFLREYRRMKAGGDGPVKPFFMYLAPANPHDPRVAAPEYLNRYDAAKVPLPANFLPLHPINNGELVIRDERLAPWPRTQDEIRRQIRDYYAVITAMDEQFGRILDCLREIGEYDNTILVFSSDQGLALGSHGLMGKQNLYEHSMGAPLVFSGPGIPRGKSSEAFAYLFDIYPTVCELVGAPVPDGLDGKSLAPVIRGQRVGVRDTIFLAYRDVQRAVRHGRWKLIRYPQVDATQLFDLEADPHETKDLAADPGQARRIRELMDLLRRQQELFGDTCPLAVDQPQPAGVTLELLEKLAAAAPKPRKPARKP